MRVAYLGRFAAGWATEEDLAQALERQGHQVTRLHESDPCSWDLEIGRRHELVIWTTARGAHEASARALLGAERRPPVIGYHLDRWWGLRRQRDITGGAFFGCDMLVTADGGHQAEWEAAGIRHHWLPPAIAVDEAALTGQRHPELAVDVAFVGSWRRYLPDWPHRLELVEHLRRWFGPAFGAWPDHAGPLRGQRLADLYASARVVVGDSCLAGGGRYWSDRIPETLGRGGFLLHPEVEGLEEHFEPGHHLATWPAGDWKALHDALGHWLHDDEGRARVAAAGRAHVIANHTYDVRARQLLELVRAEVLA